MPEHTESHSTVLPASGSAAPSTIGAPRRTATTSIAAAPLRARSSAAAVRASRSQRAIDASLDSPSASPTPDQSNRSTWNPRRASSVARRWWARCSRMYSCPIEGHSSAARGACAAGSSAAGRPGADAPVAARGRCSTPNSRSPASPKYIGSIRSTSRRTGASGATSPGARCAAIWESVAESSMRGGIERPYSRCSRALKRMPVSELPPAATKLSNADGSPVPSASAQSSATRRSVAVRGATRTAAAPPSGAGRSRRLTLPFGRRGKRSSGIRGRGTIQSGSRSRRCPSSATGSTVAPSFTR